jgi:hypothetical protein
MSPLSEAELASISQAIGSFSLLFPDAPLENHIYGLSEITAFGRINAPHYMVISGHGRPGEIENAGFLYEQWVLWMSAHGYGTVWLGITKPIKSKKDNKHIIAIAFGRTTAPLTRNLNEFNRKPLNEIVEGYDSRLEAARLAPSGNNIQPWYFIVSGSQEPDQKIYIYKKRGGMNKLFYDYPELDMGIVMSHLYLATVNSDVPFAFSADPADAPTPPKGYAYFGSVS